MTSPAPIFARSFLAIFAVTTAFAIVAEVSSAQQIRTRDPGFLPTSYYDFLLDGEAVKDASMYESSRTKTMLIVTPQLSSYVELDPRTAQVKVYSPEAFVASANGVILDNPKQAPISVSKLELATDTRMPHFTVEGRRGSLRLRAPLLGPVTRDQLLDYSKAYKFRADLYQPIAEPLATLRKVTKPVTVQVFLGTWCSSCAEIVPHILQLEQELTSTPIRFEYHGIPQDFNDPVAKQNGIVESALPVCIVRVDGVEVARSSGPTWRYPEVALQNALLQAGVVKP